MVTPPLRWHYTTGHKFEMIVEDGVIRPTDINISPGERPAVWFSIRQDWEPSAAKGRRKFDGSATWLDMEGTRLFGGGLVRIGVGPTAAPVGWREYLRTSGVHPRLARGMVTAAQERGGNPSDWFVSYRPVPRQVWRAVDVWEEGAWVSVPMTSPAGKG